MKAKQAIKVPVRLSDNGILHDTDYARGASTRDEAEAINAELAAEGKNPGWGAHYVMETVEPFTVALRLTDVYHHKSSAYAWTETREGRRYPMFLTDLSDILHGANMKDGWLEPATYEVCKRGARSYGIRKVKNREYHTSKEE